MSTLVSIVLGGFITILTAIGVEYLRKPKLKILIESPPLDRVEVTTGKITSRHLRLVLRNEPLFLLFRWMQRTSAIRCRGEITFHHLDDGQALYDRSMAARWANSPEPVATPVIDKEGTAQFFIQEVFRFTFDSRIDVYPGEEEPLDVAVRFHGEKECYGWNNESYFHEWRTPDWKLDSGRYLVKVVITSSEQKRDGLFRLVNDVEHLKDFRLIEAQPEDRAQPIGVRAL